MTENLIDFAVIGKVAATLPGDPEFLSRLCVFIQQKNSSALFRGKQRRHQA